MWSSSVSSLAAALKMTREQHSLTVDLAMDQTTVQKCGRKSKMQDECLDVSNKPFFIIISAVKN